MDDMSVFSFVKFEVSGRTVGFYYTIRRGNGDTHDLCETLTLPVDLPDNDPVVDKLLGALHIALGTSYYKTFIPPSFELQRQKLSETEADFWNYVYENGLAEFLYVNKIEPSRLAKFMGETVEEPAIPERARRPEAILAIGGGKDSIVAGELLKSLDIPCTAFVLGTGEHLGQARGVADAMKLETLGVERTLDPKILELNKLPDALNGHVPISLIFALTGLLLATLTDRTYMVVGNEASASIPNTDWHGLPVNHQWSKSFAFEHSLQAYVHEHVSTDLHYFSAIRPLTSVGVAKLFARYPQYFEAFTSCNRVFYIDPARRPNGRWCGECPKCLSSFIILAPWLDQEQLVEIFGKNLFDHPELGHLLLELTGVEGHKPLDCVGTREEIVLSLNLMRQQGKFIECELMKLARERGVITDDNWDGELAKALALQPEHGLPPELTDKLLGKLREELAR